jgi:[ribosomal protein S18]-alanine N-acetyltransferase
VLLTESSEQAQLLKFRRMVLSDIPTVHAIDHLSFSMPWPESSYHFELTQNASTLALVAELVTPGGSTTLIGMSITWIVVDEAHIATIAIHPDFRGHGYGKLLLRETLRRSIQSGAQVAALEVRESNLIAQQMYREFGFKIVGRRSRYYKDNSEDALLMSLLKMGPEYLTWLDDNQAGDGIHLG